VSDSRTFVVVGASHAGGRAVQALRQAGFEGRVVLIGEEQYLPYERPPLSKELVYGDDGIERAQLNGPDFYEEKSIELRLGARAEAIDPSAKTVRLADGDIISYDKLLLTTGARVRKLDLPGAELDGVHYLRTYDDTKAIKAACGEGTPVAVIGGGFIGLEIASSCRKLGGEVTVIEVATDLMGRAVAPEIGHYFADIHRSHGVDLKLGAVPESIEGEGKAEAVLLADGTRVPAALVVIGIGILPNVELAADAGIEVDNGIVVDEYGHTSAADIYAAGDVANQPNEFAGRRLRLESYQNAQDQGMAVARNMCADEPAPYQNKLWVWSDQYDVNLQMLGMPDAYDRLVYRGDVASGAFTVFYMKGPRIVAVNTINNGREMRIVERLMYAGIDVDDVQLAGVDVNLRQLIPKRSAG
jgi:3-phenylpropionate/trans-cinnamate dioxygenase ferredoxin reductase subunit